MYPLCLKFCSNFPQYRLARSGDSAEMVRAYIQQATKIEYEEHDPIRGRAILQRHGDRTLVVNPPAMPLCREELDASYSRHF